MFADKYSPIVIAGIACRVPGADSVDAFADLLFSGRTGYTDLPADRCDRELYFDPAKGKTGKSYTTLGGIVAERALDREHAHFRRLLRDFLMQPMFSLRRLQQRPGSMLGNCLMTIDLEQRASM